MLCPKCFNLVPEAFTKCPVCETKVQISGLVSTTGSQFVETAITRKILEEKSNSLLKKMEESDFLLSQAFLKQISYIKPEEIDGIIYNSQTGIEKDWETSLKTLMEGNIEKLNFEALQLQDLINKDKNIKNFLNIGLKFLKSGKYDEAIEWWILQREQFRRNHKPRIELILLLMEMVTYRLNMQTHNAEELIQRIRSHPEFKKVVNNNN
ncbi:hypothetical protein [Rufibacter aurantiacus]|uniref:hypothetical protein n=1 Tax=Rufibacter aurantiacus TaxID=2817374 RepID=UPI001B314F57|nr:hypothetical protein [Rufibacter aurantiacus]